MARAKKKVEESDAQDIDLTAQAIEAIVDARKKVEALAKSRAGQAMATTRLRRVVWTLKEMRKILTLYV